MVTRQDLGKLNDCLGLRKAMNAIVQKSFDGLENSLATLVESVSSYNPSPTAAIAVVDADDTLTKSLEQLDEHQQGYQKILFLRAISEALDKQLTQLLETLSDARKDVLDVPTTNFPASQEVPYDELLTYARKISKYTMPLRTSKYSQTPTTDNASDASNPLGGVNSGDSAQPDSQATARILPLGLSEEDVSALDTSHIPFAPWPSEEVMKRGALSQTAYEEELRAQGLPVPGFSQSPDANGQKTDADAVPVQPTPVRLETVTVQPLHHERPREHQPPPLGLSLSLDLYDPDEDLG